MGDAVAERAEVSFRSDCAFLDGGPDLVAADQIDFLGRGGLLQGWALRAFAARTACR